MNIAQATPTSAPTSTPSVIYVQQSGSGGFGGPIIKVVLVAGVGIAIYYWWSNTTLGQFSGWNLMNKFFNPKAWDQEKKIAQESGKKCKQQAKGSLGVASCGVSSFFSSGLGGLIKTK